MKLLSHNELQTHIGPTVWITRLDSIAVSKWVWFNNNKLKDYDEHDQLA